MPNITVIADTSCLIALSKIEAIELLKELYEEVYITKEIALEFGESLPEWVRIENVKNKKYQQLLDLYLDLGEASAIALALEKVDVLLILDDYKGRKEAEKLGFRITGTLGVLFKAKKIGLITELKSYIEKLKAVGFRLSPKIEEDILRKSNEI
jgi:predicted nucleic acid-binding protein